MCCDDDQPGAREGHAETIHHEPVFLQEVLDYLDPQPGQTFVDATLGLGGHALAICQKLGPTGCLIGIDQDADALARARQRLQGYPVRYIHDNFKNLENIITTLSVGGVDGFLFDLGVSALQLQTAERGFSFRLEADLDMRMDQRLPTTAAELVNRMSEEQLVRLFDASGYGRWARRLARAITATRKQSPITTTTAFAALVTATIPVQHHSKVHPATKAFIAVRIAVNEEIAAIPDALTAAAHHGNPGARIVVLSYSSLEDGEAKRQFNRLSGKCPPPSSPYELDQSAPPPLVSVVTKKPVSPTPDEVRRNPRSRSAKLRVAECL